MTEDYVNHKYPRVDDYVYVASRLREGKNPYASIISVDRSEREVMLLFFGAGYQLCYQRGNVKSCRDCIHTNPSWFNGGGDVDTYSFDEFEGNWSSHDGGTGQWEI